MPKADQWLVLDIGSTGLRVCEFDYPASGGFRLLDYRQVEYTEQLTEENRSLIISAALRSALEDGDFSTNRAAVCVSGQAAFMRFVKLPPVTEEESRVRQIVEYEARQNVPFPMDEVIWDYQLIGGTDDELEVMFVVIKNDIVEGIIEAVNSVGLKPEVVDFGPAALYNVARANHVGDDECVMILNIGGRCTNLLFLDGDRFFARTIPIAGYSITQQIAKEFSITPDEAEILKRRHGFVALGGAYEEPESEVAATISKIVRNVMTRLHGEVNRSISVYRTQQKGNKPCHLYLSGGSSTMAFTDHFFSEKLRMDVSYLNPFKIVGLDPKLSVDDLQKHAHAFPEAVGVGLRNLIECPVEVSLIPDSIKQQQLFSKRKPFIFGSMVVWLLILAVFLVVNNKKITLYKKTAGQNRVLVEKLDQYAREIKRQIGFRDEVESKVDSYNTLLANRYIWSDLYREIQLAMPNDVWLGHIEILTQPVVGAPAEEEPEEDVALNRTRHSFFGALQANRQRPAEVVEEEADDQIMWFAITGHCVTIPGRKIFADEQLEIFDKMVVEALAELKKQLAGDGPAADAEATADAAEGDAAEGESGTYAEIEEFERPPNKIARGVILPELFVEALWALPTFSEDDQETRILSFQSHKDFQNVSTFKIQVKLMTPIEFVR